MASAEKKERPELLSSKSEQARVDSGTIFSIRVVDKRTKMDFFMFVLLIDDDFIALYINSDFINTKQLAFNKYVNYFRSLRLYLRLEVFHNNKQFYLLVPTLFQPITAGILIQMEHPLNSQFCYN